MIGKVSEPNIDYRPLRSWIAKPLEPRKDIIEKPAIETFSGRTAFINRAYSTLPNISEENKIISFRKKIHEFYKNFNADLSNFKFNREDLHDRDENE